ncbi:hypothetical protein [Bacillus xiapuensis]|uniref:Uncharacterized protein n=1 Tax=Bacillus xiapuensis TaxID=2014075 RepID=A0ABU6NAS3_9BACI|nr:hypothetical protein [Bacillus xiapuensis]
MTFLEKTTNAYRDAMMKKGVSEDVVNYCLFAFETGFNAGTFKESDIELQEKMIKLILGES